MQHSRLFLLVLIAFSGWFTGCAPSTKSLGSSEINSTSSDKSQNKHAKPSSTPNPNLDIIKAKRKAEYESLVLANTDTSKFVFVEYHPEFPGGPKAMSRYIYTSMRYPAPAARDGVSGRVIGTFVIDENGEITDLKIVKSVRWDIDQEYIRIMNAMPAWIPGFQNGKAVKVKFTVPVMFDNTKSRR